MANAGSSSVEHNGASASSTTPSPMLMAAPMTGSANPAASLHSLWSYMTPALDYILCSPCNISLHDLSFKTPAIDPAYHMGIHTAVYNYYTGTRKHRHDEPPDQSTPDNPNGFPALMGSELYTQLDRYFESVVRDILLGAPLEDSELIPYYVTAYTRYAAGLQAIHRLLNYVNRHYVRREVDDDRGWLRLADLGPLAEEEVISTTKISRNGRSITHLNTLVAAGNQEEARQQVVRRLRGLRMKELKKWGYVEGDGAEKLAQAEQSAEAASTLDRVVPIQSLAYRRWRLDCIEPLLTIPDEGQKPSTSGGRTRGGRRSTKSPPPTKSPPNAIPKGRLARACKMFFETGTLPMDDKLRSVQCIRDSFLVCGVRRDVALLKRLEKYLASP
ncbi:hypothetical protein SISNIDRAFT_457832 [Sistotremastrum niveocremeum HHB9708]|uniref:Uncharacterized protein n=2 Tax=Sistotremastraceae TaxID=3402574 RepID=A0A164R6Y9_9AGAM|nr:hypothetical protein SISNIDRAFT_457832 [Sistotremastrum niveocremeum HHB9708]KZT42804.1 hypothetical protein SISSUDRAFT_1041056 [Sistotremastrum suecicum HHB10207 ss-3]